LEEGDDPKTGRRDDRDDAQGEEEDEHAVPVPHAQFATASRAHARELDEGELRPSQQHASHQVARTVVIAVGADHRSPPVGSEGGECLKTRRW